jgi:chaperonin GroES
MKYYQNYQKKKEDKMLPANLSPVGERVLVEMEETQKTTASGILIPDSAKSNEVTGKVLAVGAGARTETGTTIPMTVKVGDVVVFPKTAVQDITINGKKYAIVKESDVYGIMG